MHGLGSFKKFSGRSGERTLGSRLIRIADSREKKRATNNMVTLEVKVFHNILIFISSANFSKLRDESDWKAPN